MNFAVLRFQKIKTMAALAAMAGHWDRSRETINADPNREVRFLVGPDVAAEVQRRLPEKRRKDATLAIEGVLSATGEYYRPSDPGRAGYYEKDRLDDFVDASMRWARNQFGDNLASAVLHLDEITPHIQLIVVPLTRRGTLSARDLFGPQQMREYQTSYGKALAPLGIARGRPGSTATHEHISRYYEAVNDSLEPVELTVADRAILIGGGTPETIFKLQAQAGEVRRAKQATTRADSDAHKAAIAAMRGTELLKEEQAAHKATQNRLRAIALDELLPKLGYKPDPARPLDGWIGPAGALDTGKSSGKPNQFRFKDTGKGGRGAIDLVKQCEGYDYAGAVGWLAIHVDAVGAVATAASNAEEHAQITVNEAKLHPPPLLKLSSAEADRAAIAGWLTETQALPRPLVTSLIKGNYIGAVRAREKLIAAFPLVPAAALGTTAKPIGYALFGANPGDTFAATRGERGVWGFNIGKPEGAGQDARVFVRTPLEAIALRALSERQHGLLPDLERPGRRLVSFVAVGGGSPKDIKALIELSRGAELFDGFGSEVADQSPRRVLKEEAEDAKLVLKRLSIWADLVREQIRGVLQLWQLIRKIGLDAFLERRAGQNELGFKGRGGNGGLSS
ncbi:hypothetical protein ASF27_11745 [Methylobacterium sp. Leaf102]|uniref:MobV family relaxase n=1 Tax=Methylobacterium sp. Leaf102 TaxID=1736253 RepID=UPI0006F7F4F1|nr:MobV family relaxase [Methylobacterium sp. Leaf102]KQP24740.1 hypothetical protein ASF27_11745 [Methylobacterium sp. Leaf102]